MSKRLVSDLKPCVHEAYGYRVWADNGQSWVEKYPNPILDREALPNEHTSIWADGTDAITSLTKTAGEGER